MIPKSQHNGTRALALLVAVTMLLTVFVGAAAAGSVDTVGVLNETDTSTDADSGVNITTDSLAGSSEGTVQDVINVTVDDDVNSTDVVQLQLDDSNIDDKDDFEINKAEIITDDLDGASASAEIAPSEGPYVGVDDAINVTFGNDASGFGTGSFNLSVEVTVASQVDSKAYTSGEYDRSSIIEITEDGTDSGLDSTPAADLSVEPGDPAQFNVHDSNYADYDTKSYLNVTFQDHAGNTVNDTVTATEDVDFTLSGSEISDRTVTNATDHDGDPTTANVTILNGSKNPAGAIDAAVGTFDLTASSENFSASTTEEDIEIDVPEVTTGVTNTTFDAGSGQSDINVTLRGSGTQIPDSDVGGVDITLDTANTDSADPTIDGTTTDSFTNNSVTVGETTYRLTSTTATTGENRGNAYDLDVNTLGNDNNEVTNINVNPTKPTDIGLTQYNNSEGTLSNGETAITLGVSVQDTNNNVVDVSKFYDGSTDINVTVNDDHRQDRYQVLTVTQASEANQTIDIKDDASASDEIGARVGTFSVDATQEDVEEFSDLNDNSLNNDITIVPDTISIQETQGSNVTAADSLSNNNLKYEVTLENGSGSAYQNQNISSVQFNITGQGTAADDTIDKFPPEGIDNVTTNGEFTLTAPFSSPGAANNIPFDAYESRVGAQTVTATVTNGTIEPSGQSGEYYIEPATPTDAQITNINESFVGIIEDENPGNVTIDLELTDQFNNYANYKSGSDNFPSDGINVTVAGLNGSDAGAPSLRIQRADATLAKDVQNLDSNNATLTVDFEPTDISNTTTTGEDRDVISVDNGVSASGDTDTNLTHEAYSLNSGSNRFSLPNEANVYTKDIDYTSTYNGSNYNASLIDLSDPGTREVQSGILANGTSSNARIGFDYPTSPDEVSPDGTYQLEEGWNFVGTNFDISDDGNLPEALEDDLVDVIPIRDDHNDAPYVYDGELSSQLDASSDSNSDTSDLTPTIDPLGQGNGEYGTYWVKVNSTNTDDWEREIIKSEYNPSDRFGN